MRISQNYFRCVVAIPVKPTKWLPLTSEEAEGGEPKEGQLEASQRRQTRSQAKPTTEDEPKPTAKVGQFRAAAARIGADYDILMDVLDSDEEVDGQLKHMAAKYKPPVTPEGFFPVRKHCQTFKN